LVIVTDKEASFGLPYLSGKMDYAQFFSKDLSFLNWCRDLFSYYWDRAKPMLGPFPSPS
jgi:predicted transcriptional regulator